MAALALRHVATDIVAVRAYQEYDLDHQPRRHFVDTTSDHPL
jgi:hypothetical protein